MYLTTFKQEALPNPHELIIKSLFVLVIKWDMPNTYTNLRLSYDSDRLIYLYNMLKDSNHLYITMVNPVEYTLIAKQIVKPVNRQGIDEDFDKVDTNLLLAYLHNLNILSTTVSLN